MVRRPFLEDILVRLSAARGESTEEYRRSVAASFCLSADAGHLVHPNYQGHHDPTVQPLPGGGPLLKINANQRYATDSVGAGVFAAACAKAGVPYQEFVSNNNMPCGSTITDYGDSPGYAHRGCGYYCCRCIRCARCAMWTIWRT